MNNRDKDMLLITLEDGRQYLLDPKVVAENRANYFAFQGEEYEEAFEESMSDLVELQDWLLNNMEFEDIQMHAEFHKGPPMSDMMEDCQIVRSFKK